MKELEESKGGLRRNITKDADALNVIDVIQVEIVGAALVAQAIKELLQAQPGFSVEDDVPNSLPRPRIVLIIGQSGMAVLKRRQLRSTRRRRQERFALLTDGKGIDFRLARDLPMRVFIGTEDSISLFLQGLRAAASDDNFCSPQVLPFLLAAASSPNVNASEASRALYPSAAAPLHNAIRPSQPVRPPAPQDIVSAVAGKGAALSAEMRRALRRGLSDREAEIALQAGQGLSNQQIADATSITLSTVKFHLYRVYQKLGIERRSQLSGLTSSVEQETMV